MTGARNRAASPAPRAAKDEGLARGAEDKPKEEAARKAEEEEVQEFGGAPGAAFIMVTSHALLFLMAASLYGGSPAAYAPTPKSVAWLLGYHASQVALARYMPGVFVKGQDELGYWCNAYSSFWVSLAGAFALHATGVFDLADLAKEFPAILTTGVILGDIYSVIIHLCYAYGTAKLFSIYDFFIGIGVHPRIGIVDIKMVAETRVSWTFLFLITFGSFVDATRRSGTPWNPAAFMVLAHGLYANACAKGEHFIPYTWDITTEKFGWMLCWWNLAGVPLLYCYQSLFLAHHLGTDVLLPLPAMLYYPVLVVALLLAYWIWDEANYHKCYFKMEQRGNIIRRNLFPTFRHVKNAKYIKCDAGVLLIDGWYAWARKIHYTADTAMALLWGLCCGFGSALPYVYFGFFVAMITHRAGRDEARCRQKYGALWDKYLQAVPYRFVPGVY